MVFYLKVTDCISSSKDFLRPCAILTHTGAPTTCPQMVLVVKVFHAFSFFFFF